MRLFLCFLLSSFSFGYAKSLQVSLSAESAILINADTGQVIFEKNPHLRLYPASITKIATALYALKQRGSALDELALATKDSVSIMPTRLKSGEGASQPSYRLEPDGTTIGIQPGEMLSLRTLLYGLMLCSGNDAANVIAQHVSGNIPQFVEDLNFFFLQMGLNNTHFTNPHGLHHQEHFTTAYDMAMIAREAMKNPIFKEIVKSIQYVRPESNKQSTSTFLQHNRLLKKGALFYPKAIGIKTGYHSKAGYTLVAAAKQEDRTLIAVLLNCSEINQRYKDAISLFETAFSERKVNRVLFNKNFDTFSTVLQGASSSLIAGLSEDLNIEYFPSEEPDFKIFLQWKPVPFPITKGVNVGEVVVRAYGREIKKAPLFATVDVDPTLSYRLSLLYCSIRPIIFHRAVLISLMGIVSIWAFISFRKAKKIP